MDMVDKIEEFLVQEDIATFCNSLQDQFRYQPICEELVSEMQSLLDSYLDTLSKDFIYDYEVLTNGRTIKFQFDIKRRFLYGFLG